MTVQIQVAQKVDIPRLLLQTKYATVPGADRTLGQCLVMSQAAWLGCVDEKVACLWGLIPPTLISNRAYLWLLTTELVNEHQFLFIRHSQRMVEVMLREYDLITGHVKAGEDRSIRWLRWLGAVFGDPQGQLIPFGIVKRHG